MDINRKSCRYKQSVNARNASGGSMAIATGYNGPPRGEPHCTTCKRIGHAHNDGNYTNCNSVHAEMNAIISASRSEMIGSTLYLYGEENDKEIEAVPCPICKRMIKNAGIKKVKMNHLELKIQSK